MSWMEERIAESKRLEDAGRLVSQHAPVVYENLWEEIKKLIAEAERHGLQVFTNGSPENRELRLATKPTAAQHASTGKTVRLILSKDRKTIEAKGLDIRFGVGVCADGVVCLNFNDEDVSVQRAAEEIFDRFLFPDLPRRN